MNPTSQQEERTKMVILKTRAERIWMKGVGVITFALMVYQVIKDGHP